MARNNRTAEATTEAPADTQGQDQSTDTMQEAGSGDDLSDGAGTVSGDSQGDDTTATASTSDLPTTAADAATAAGDAQATPAPAGMSSEAADEMALRFGRVCVAVLRAQHGDDGAVGFVNAIVQPTAPGSAERKLQDKAFKSLTRRFKAK